MNLQLVQGTPGDFPAVRVFYDHVIDDTPDMASTAMGKKGLHPGDDTLWEYIGLSALYFLREGETIRGVMAVTAFQTEEYHAVGWGFVLRGAQKLYAGNTGRIDFLYYEPALE